MRNRPWASIVGWAAIVVVTDAFPPGFYSSEQSMILFIYFIFAKIGPVISHLIVQSILYFAVVALQVS